MTALNGKYKAYPEYEKSKSNWFEFLPSHWNLANLRWISNLYAGGTPSKENLSFWENGSIPWINSGAVNQSLVTEPSAFITRDAFNHSSAKWIPNGSLVMALAGQGKTKGMVAQLAIDSTCNQSMAAIVPSQGISPRFLFWWLTNNYQNIRNMAGGDLRDGLNLELLGSISCPILDNQEQQQIANFLDHETAKIDTLIAKQQRLIELLQEKRQAVISHAVTKGLNPDAPMKDSGVEWLGQIPRGWGISKVRHISSFGRGLSITKAELQDTGIPCVSYGEVHSKFGFEVDPKKHSLKCVSDEYLKTSPYALLSKGDVVFADTSEDIDGAGNFTQLVSDEILFSGYHTIIVRLSQSDCYRFVAYLFDSSQFRNQIRDAVKGVKVFSITQTILKSADVWIPPYKEQQKIANFLDQETAKIDALIEKANQASELLKERKTALISAAVTGKIDVRDWEAK